MARLQLLAAFSLLLLSASSASPIANATTTNYQREPKTRGTIDLLLSCTLTLVLCVWTALHLNIEPLESSRSKHAGASRLAGKAIWGLAALVAPELVLSIALHQFLVAWQYRKALSASSVFGDITIKGGVDDASGEEGAEVVRDKEVGLKKAFYAIMGGFAVEGTKSFAVTLDMDMLENDATVEKIRRYPIAQIDDKSKADYLAKVLACLQAGWIVLECLGRKLTGLPITLLELNTVLHVVNAVVMYGVWWKKPVDVGQPSIIGQSEEEWKNESMETTSFLPVDILLSSQRRVKERIVPLLRSEDNQSRLLAAQIDRCDLSDDILRKLKGWLTLLDLFKAVAGVASITAGLLAANIDFFASQPTGAFGQGFGEALGEAFGEAYGDALGEAFGEAFGMELGGEFAGAVGSGLHRDPTSVEHEAFRRTFPGAFRATILRAFRGAPPKAPLETSSKAFYRIFPKAHSRTPPKARRRTFSRAFQGTFSRASRRMPPKASRARISGASAPAGIPVTILRDMFRNDARALREDCRKDVREAVRAAASSPLGTDSSLPREAACGQQIVGFILPPSPMDTPKSQDDLKKYFESVASYADLLLFVHDAIRKENTTGIIEDEPLRPETRQKIHGEVFLHVRQRALDIANDSSKGDAVRAAALKAAFHLDPRVAGRPDDVESASLGILEQLGSTLSDGGRHIRNQFIRAPGIFGEGEELKLFDRRWCNTHRAVLLVFATCSGAFYGGMHAFKWDDHFPSEIERILWEVSTCVGAAGVVPLAILAVILWTKPSRWVSLVCWALFVVSGLVFLAARIFLIVESFICVRDLPVRAYETVQWAETIPHI